MTAKKERKINKKILRLSDKHPMVEFIGIADLAFLGDKKPITLRQWEQKGWLPPANYFLPATTLPDGSKRNGARLYSYHFALKISAEIRKVKRGFTVDTEVIRSIAILFKEEREYFSQ